jgi:hypothetical protein
MPNTETLEVLQLQREVIELKSTVLQFQHRDLLAKIAKLEAEAAPAVPART